MAFDIKTAKPLNTIPSTFDINTAKPVSSKNTMFQNKVDTVSNIAGGVAGTGIGLYGGTKAAHLIPKATGDVARRVAGVGTKSVKWLKQRGTEQIFHPLKEQVDYIGTYLTNELDDIVKGQVQSLDEYFEQTINSVKDSTKISLPKTKAILGKLLGTVKLIGKNSKPTKLLNEPAVSNSVYRKLYDVFDFIKRTSTITKGQVELIRDTLNNLYKGTPGDVLVSQTKEAVYDDLETSGVENLGRAVKGYKIARELEKYPAKKIYSVLTRIANPKTADLAVKELREIVPQYADDIANNIKDHLVAMEFSRTQGISSKSLYPSRAGFFRDITRAGLKGYYENVYPLIQRGKSLIPKIPKPSILIKAGKPLLKGAKIIGKVSGKVSLPGIILSEMIFPQEAGTAELTPEQQGLFAAQRHAKGIYEKGYPIFKKP